MEGVPRPVDDRLQQLVPCARRRRKTGDVVDEPELVELIALGTRLDDVVRAPGGTSTSVLHAGSLRRHAHHLTRVGTAQPEEGCDAVAARLRYRPSTLGPMSATRARARSARAAEPAGIGSAHARDPLALEVRLLGALLGQVITEQAGEGIYDLVERLRLAAIAFRHDEQPEVRERLDAELDALELEDAEAVITAFSLYFQLVNLAEARARVRALRRRERAARDGLLDDSVAEAVARLRRAGRTDAELDAIMERLRITPVLTAHPTEARRRTTLVALRRCAVLLERFDDTRLTPSDDRETRRRLREEISVLWRTSDLRAVSPEPLDEVRTAMAIFDATLFQLAPRLYRAVDAVLDPESGARAPRVAGVPPLRLVGRWRPGRQPGGHGRPDAPGRCASRPTTSCMATRPWRMRLMQTVSATTSHDRVARPLATRLARDAEELPETDRQLRRRFPDEPYRQRFGFIAERLRRTRAVVTGETGPRAGHYEDADALDTELGEIQDALVDDGLERVAWGEVAELRWQVATFGFHLASLEIRQHSAVHRQALDTLEAGGDPAAELAPGVTTAEVLATFRSIGEGTGALRTRGIQARGRLVHGRARAT